MPNRDVHCRVVKMMELGDAGKHSGQCLVHRKGLMKLVSVVSRVAIS